MSIKGLTQPWLMNYGVMMKNKTLEKDLVQVLKSKNIFIGDMGGYSIEGDEGDVTTTSYIYTSKEDRDSDYEKIIGLSVG